MTPPSPHESKPPGDPLLKGVNLGGLFSIGMTDEFEAGAGAGAAAQAWTPPPVEEVADLFPGHEVKKLIGRGGMGAVYEARQLDLDRRVAIKLLPRETSLDEAFVQRFQREARALARLQHPGIVAVHQSGTARDGRLYFVMEHVDGTTLFDLIHGGHLTVPQALEIVKQICEALAYAHEEGVVHRDIKPSNILVDKKGRVKVADFGLAKVARSSHSEAASLMHTQTGHVMGTPDYAAPEQMRGGVEVDHRADIYSLGVMFYEMLTGQVPRGLFVPPSEKSGTDVRLDQVVLRALHENPERRYQQATQMRDEVTRTQAEELPGADVEPPSPTSSFASKVPALVLFVIFMVIVFVVVTSGPPGRGFRVPEEVQRLLSGKSSTATPSVAKRSEKPAIAAAAAKPASTPDPKTGVATPSLIPSKVAPPEPPIAFSAAASFGGRRYLFHSQPLFWARAHEQARKRGGRLASATSREVSDWLARTFAKNTKGVFLGGQCWMPGGAWEWDSGAKWGFSAWAGEPPIYGVLILQPDGTWKAGSYDDALPFIIELPE
ncbi:MAG: protein kinase domain-containing protein [Prosthecobacter sp.]